MAKKPIPKKSSDNNRNAPGGVSTGIVKNMKLPRGIRNNNPGNLRLTKIAWKGKVPNSQNTDGAFEQFISPFYGFRAAAKDILSDYAKGKTTVAAIISEYAPPNENNTSNYISRVCKAVGVASNEFLNVYTVKKIMPQLLHIIHIVENGKEFFTIQQIEEFTKQMDI